MNVEAYIIVRQVDNIEEYFLNSGYEEDLSTVFMPVYQDLESSEYINISNSITGINGFHKAIDETTFSIFESSDLSMTLSLLRKDNDVDRLNITDSDAFYNKLLTNSLYIRIQDLAHRNGLDKHVKWDFSIYFPEVDIKFYGTIDLQTIEINESNGNCTFTVYDSMNTLGKINSNVLTYGEDFRRWYTSISPLESLNTIQSKLGLHMNEFLPPNFDISDPIPYNGWSLSFYKESDIELETSSDGDESINQVIYDGEKFWVVFDYRLQKHYTIDDDFVWSSVSPFSTNLEPTTFCNWQAQNNISYTPPVGIPTGIPMFNSAVIIGNTTDSISKTFFNSNDQYIYFIGIDFNGGSTADYSRWYIKKRKFNGWTTVLGEYLSGWDATLLDIAYKDLSDPQGGKNDNLSIIVTELNDIYFVTGIKVMKYSTTSSTFSQLYSSTEDAGYFTDIKYYKQSNKIVVIKTEDLEPTSTVKEVRVLDAVTNATIKLITRESIPSNENFDSYELDYTDINWDSTFEIRISDTVAGAGTYYMAGLTKGDTIRFFILTGNLSLCVFYTDLSKSLSLPNATTAYITRGIKDVEETLRDGSIVTRQYNIIFGYIGGGTIENGAFFKYDMGHSGNIRSLNFKDMKLFESYSEIAKFTGSYFFIDHEVRDIDGKNIARPQVNIISRKEGRSDIVNYELDRLWSSWKWKAQYKNYMGIILCKYNGGVTKSGGALDSLDFFSDSLSPLWANKQLTSVSSIPEKSIEFKLVYDQNIARWRGNEYLLFYWDAKQLWTINTEIKNFRLIDFVRLRYSEGGKYDRTAQIIAIDFYPTTKKAVIKAITTNEQLSVPPNPLIQTSYLPNQLGDIGQGNV